MSEGGPSRPIEISGVSRRAGAMVLAAIVLMIGAVLMAAYRQHWFAPTVLIQALLPEAGTFGLTDGAPVNLLGRPIGTVQNVTLESDGRLRAQLLVRKEFLGLIRKDSKGFIRLRFGVVGDAFIELTQGTGAPFDPQTGVLQTEPYEDIFKSTRHLLQQMNDPNGPYARLLTNLVRFTDTINNNPHLAEMLADKDFLRDLRVTVAQAPAAMKLLPPAVDSLGLMGRSLESSARSFAIMDQRQHEIAQGLDQTRTGLESISRTLQAEMKELPGAMRQLQSVLSDVQPVVRSLQATTDRLPRLIESLQTSLELVPDLILQAEYALTIVERTFERLDWTLGGTFLLQPKTPGSRLPPADVRNSGGVP